MAKYKNENLSELIRELEKRADKRTPIMDRIKFDLENVAAILKKRRQQRKRKCWQLKTNSNQLC